MKLYCSNKRNGGWNWKNIRNRGWEVIEDEVLASVVEPFLFGPAPASHDGGTGSSSSPVVHNLLPKKEVFFYKFHFSIYQGFIHRKVRVLCFALPVLYFKGQINFNLHYCKTFCLFLFFKHEVRAGAWAVKLERSCPFFHGSGSDQKGRLWLDQAPQHWF